MNYRANSVGLQMESHSSNNIFDVASKKGKVQPPKSQISPPLPKVFTPNKESTDSAHSFSEVDIEMMFAKMKEMQSDLDRKTNELKETISSSPTEVVKFFSDPKNFTPEQWNIIQNNRSELEQKTWAVVGNDPKKQREKQLTVKETKSRKAKSLGSRHNWIPIR